MLMPKQAHSLSFPILCYEIPRTPCILPFEMPFEAFSEIFTTHENEWRIQNCGNNEKCTYLNRVLQEASSTDLEPVGEEIC